MDPAPGLPEWLEDRAAAPHWRRIGFRPRFGLCTPLASVRSDRDCGVGDVADLVVLVDWAVEAGASLVQVLPVHDMGTGCVPYAAISAFALDPIYVALDRVEAVQSDPVLMRRVREAGAWLNRADRVDFGAVRREKEAILAEAWARVRGRELTTELERFRERNPWLDSYALFRVIREAEGHRSWEEWAGRWGEAEKARLVRERSGDLERVYYAQWVLDQQWREALAHARARGVFLVGDVPILVGRDSADVWERPGLFRLDSSAGAPPDLYAADGQNWGFPTYEWRAHRETEFAWWRARLRHLEHYFDLYRIDHVVGFFRIWTIPASERTGRTGRFVPEDEREWGRHGREILEMMLGATRMLPLAEDLGTIPPVCRETLRDLGICGLKIQRWERDWDGDGHFVAPREYPPLSVAMLSTHDSETFAGWWEAFPEDRRRLHEAAGFSGEVPSRLDPGLHAEFVRWFSEAGSVFLILMVQDVLAPLGWLPGDPASHRINVPGVVNDTNWRWRWPVKVEQLMDDREGCARIREWIGPRRAV